MNGGDIIAIVILAAIVIAVLAYLLGSIGGPLSARDWAAKRLLWGAAP
jgi:hypothetical protein